MGKTRKRITVWRALQIIFYALGFPLLVHLVLLSCKPLMENDLTAKTGIYGVLIALGIWVVVIIAQLLMRAFCKKNRMTRAIVVSIIALVVTLGPVLYCDFILKAEIDKTVAEYEEKDIEIEHYEHQITDFKEFSEDTKAEIDAFMTVYNIEFASKDYNAGGKNTDGSEVVYDEENDVYLSPNGMYSDGYRFSYGQAKKVLRDYYSAKLAYEAKEEDVEVALQTAIEELEANPSSAWSKYKAGTAPATAYVSSSDEYVKAYGEDGSATKYYIDEDRLNAIVSVIGAKLGSNAQLGDLLANPAIAGILPASLNIDEILGMLNEDLTLDQIIELVNGLGLGATLNQLFDPESTDTTIDKAFLFSLLSNFSSYQSPTTYPVFHFIEDEQLRDYAYAKYYATIHGAKIGSVLVGKVDDQGNETVGLITLSDSGVINPYTGSELLEMFDNWDIQEEIQNKYYFIFAVRENLLKMSFAIVFSLICVYFFTNKIDKEYAKLTLKRQGGAE